MKEFNVESIESEHRQVISSIQAPRIEYYAAYIGLGVHKDTIAWSVAVNARAEPEYGGEIANRPDKFAKLVERLSKRINAQVLLWCYDAGPCG